MGLGDWLQKKGRERRERKDIENRMNVALKREEEQAFFEGKRKGTIQRARERGIKAGKGGGGLGSRLEFVNPMDMGGVSFDAGGMNLGGLGGGRSERKAKSRGRGTTITVNGTKITVHGKRKQKRKKHEPGFFF